MGEDGFELVLLFERRSVQFEMMQEKEKRPSIQK